MKLEHEKPLSDFACFGFNCNLRHYTVVLLTACVRVLLAHFGSYDKLPLTLEAPVVDLEVHSQDEDTRRRAAHLRHLPLTTSYTLVELDLSRQGSSSLH